LSWPIVGIFLYLIMNLLTFAFYGWDKRAAKKQQRRIPESRLHWLAFLGGWPGALFGQKYFRHKTIKTRFRVVFWLTIGANLLLLVMGSFFAEMGIAQGMSLLQSWCEIALGH